MKLTNEFDPIRQWAREKGILDTGTSSAQTIKLGEEFGELCAGLYRKSQPDISDAIGDMIVVLTSLAFLNGLTIEDCINGAYIVISKRKGIMEEGQFMKESSLKSSI